MTKQYGILAYPAKHSLSAVMQNAAFKALGIDAQYGLFEIPENELADFMKQVRHEPISGLSVSLPYKQVILEYLDEIHEDARKIGAVNTVMNNGGFLHGYNVDFIGAIRALEEVCGSLKGKRVTVLGAGGAARAICYGLLKEGAKVSIYNRDVEMAEKLAREFSEMFGVDVKYGSLGETSKASGDILIQATSIWMTASDSKLEDLISLEALGRFDIVMDIVYVPLKTPLIKAAAELGKKIITGDKMLLYQGMEQFKLWIGKEAPIQVMRNALEKNL